MRRGRRHLARDVAPRARALPLVLVALALWLGACPRLPVRIADEPSLHLHELLDVGDPTRRASLRLVLEGLEADARGESRRAQGLYDRALQIDSGNPYAYLALARHHVERGHAEAALDHLARARDLAESEDASPRVEVHLDGLRGAALALRGAGGEGDPWLARAARAAPGVWGDGRLEAEELY